MEKVAHVNSDSTVRKLQGSIYDSGLLISGSPSHSIFECIMTSTHEGREEAGVGGERERGGGSVS